MAKILGLERVLCRLKDGTGLVDPLGSTVPDLLDHGNVLKSKEFEFSR
jgi:hypothetical protein